MAPTAVLSGEGGAVVKAYEALGDAPGADAKQFCFLGAWGHAPGCVQAVVGGQVWVVVVGEDPAELSPAAQVLSKLVVPTPGKPFGLA